MAIVNLNELTEFQRYGIQIITQSTNDSIKDQNDVITYRNSILPSGVSPETLVPEYTEQTMADLQFTTIADAFWQQAKASYYQNVVIPAMEALTPEEQLTLRAQFGLPNMIKE